jgi:hypothetical protein
MIATEGFRGWGLVFVIEKILEARTIPDGAVLIR